MPRRQIGPWFRVSTTFHSHPKAIRVGVAGRDAYLAAMGWSTHFATDGEVPDAAWRGVVAQLGHDPDELGALLVQARLLDLGDDGYLIHDFSEWQQTATERAKARADAQARMVAYRAKVTPISNGARTPNKRRTN